MATFRELLRHTGQSLGTMTTLGGASAGAAAAVAWGCFPGFGGFATWPIPLMLLGVAAGNIAFYGAIAWIYLNAHSGRPSRQVVGRVAAALALLVACGVLPHANPIATAYLHARYAGKLYMLACLFALLAIGLPHETRILISRLRPWLRRPLGGGLAAWGIAAVSVAVAETVFCALFVKVPHDIPPLGYAAFALNVLLVACAIAFLFALTNRLGFATVVVIAMYLALACANLVKVAYLHNAVQPADAYTVTEFFPFFTMYFNFWVQGGLAVVLGGWVTVLVVAWRRSLRVSWRGRLVLGAASTAILVAMSGMWQATARDAFLQRLELEPLPWNSLVSVSHNGLLLEAAMLLPDMFVSQPPGYGENEIARCAREYCPASERPLRASPREPVDLVICFVESLIHPDDLGVRLTADPIPVIRRIARTHSSGYAIVPGKFQGSADSSFEVLTGMSMAFLPPSCAYKSHVKRELPSLPRLLEDHGYATSVVHAHGPDMYNYVQAYRRLHVAQPVWLLLEPGLPRDVAGRWPSDEVVAERVAEMAQRCGPQFVCTINNGSHGPYNYPQYLDSELDVADPIDAETRRELKTYLNAIRTADQAIGRLLERIVRSPKKTVVLILGDHLPPLAKQGGVFAAVAAEGPVDLDLVERQRRVPVVIWSNFPSPRERLMCSTNFLAVHVLERMGIEPTGFLAAVRSLHRQLKVLSRFIETADGRRYSPEGVPDDVRRAIDDYRLLQYDTLFGERYLEAACGSSSQP